MFDMEISRLLYEYFNIKFKVLCQKQGAKVAGMIPILYNRKNSPITTGHRDFIEVKSMREIENLKEI